MFDRSYLPAAPLEFVVLTDTHYMVDPGDAPLEFESRRKQTGRVEQALRLAMALHTPFLVHLGDLIQEHPRSPLYRRALEEARAQLDRHLAGTGIRIYHAAGNQDIGDKPDPTMPTEPVTAESLAAYQAVFGRSWYSFDAGDAYFVVINSSLLNASLPATAEQRQWLESDLATRAGERIFLFMHHPPYLFEPEEPGLGHYDNLGHPDRAWLLGLLRRYRVEALFCGHSHFAWFDRIGRDDTDLAGTRFFICPSTSFTRPGFSELFSSAPPPEQGRDDTGKLGFYLVRVQADGLRAHLVRTEGMISPPPPAARAPGRSTKREGGALRLLTRLSRDLPHSPLGVTLTHPLTSVVDVPLAWPSVVRQRVRNDYPLLALLELGARHVRFPAADLDDPQQRRRLALLREEGVALTATWLWQPALDLPAAVAQYVPLVETVEVQLPGATLPPPACLEQMSRCMRDLGVTVSLGPVLPKELVPGKQLRRTRIGYRLDEVAALDQWLAGHGARLDRALCRVDAAMAPWEALLTARDRPALAQIGALDWAVALPAGGGAEHATRAAEALFVAALAPGARVFLEPLIDLDRTMDVYHGLLDRLCNPRPAFHAVRCLNTILFAGEPSLSNPLLEGVRPTSPALRRDDGTYRLVRASTGEPDADAVCLVVEQEGNTRQCWLAAGLIEAVPAT